MEWISREMIDCLDIGDCSGLVLSGQFEVTEQAVSLCGEAPELSNI